MVNYLSKIYKIYIDYYTVIKVFLTYWTYFENIKKILKKITSYFTLHRTTLLLQLTAKKGLGLH